MLLLGFSVDFSSVFFYDTSYFIFVLEHYSLVVMYFDHMFDRFVFCCCSDFLSLISLDSC